MYLLVGAPLAVSLTYSLVAELCPYHHTVGDPQYADVLRRAGGLHTPPTLQPVHAFRQPLLQAIGVLNVLLKGK